MKLVNIKYTQCINLCGYIHVHVHVYCDMVCSTHIVTCCYVIVSYLIMNDSILTAAIIYEAYIYKLITCLIMNTK